MTEQELEKVGEGGNGLPVRHDPLGPSVPLGFVGQAPPRVGVLEAARRYPLVVIVPMLALMAMGIFIAMRKETTYTAQARLTVGRINLNAPGALAGYASATQALATQFARSADATQVLEPVAEKLDIPIESVRKRVSASPIPESPVFTVKATGPTDEGAVALANAVSASVVEYARELNDRDPDSAPLLGEYKRTVGILASREARVDQLRSQLEEEKSDALRRSLARARASRDFWKLREESLSERYLAATQGESSSRLLAVLNQAENAASDRSRWIQILGFAGLVTGLLVGLGLATWLANRTLRRRLAQAP